MRGLKSCTKYFGPYSFSQKSVWVEQSADILCLAYTMFLKYLISIQDIKIERFHTAIEIYMVLKILECLAAISWN